MLTQRINVVLIGATGAGKSTTINALAEKLKAGVGKGSDPKTKTILGYDCKPFILWDTPGLGESPEKDQHHAQDIVKFMNQKSIHVDALLLIIEGCKRDLGSTYVTIKDIVTKLRQQPKLILGINQSDLAMKGMNWRQDTNQPNPALQDFLQQQLHSFQSRLQQATGIQPDKALFYAAARNYNIQALREVLS